MDVFVQMPLAAPILFTVSSVFCLASFYWTAIGSSLPQSKNRAAKITAAILVWIILQLILTNSGLYIQHMSEMPPKIIVFGVIPIVALFLLMFKNNQTKRFIDSLPLDRVTGIHLVRIIVEIGLYYVHIGQKIPKIMTFAGQNFDILAGLTAPIIIYLSLNKKKLSNTFILAWNIISLGLLFYIILLAFLSAPSPLQQLAFDQPNIAIFMTPYSLLPTFIVPMVIFMHLVSIRQLTK